MNIYKVGTPFLHRVLRCFPPRGARAPPLREATLPARLPRALQRHRQPSGARGRRGAAAIPAPGPGQVLS